MSKTPSQNQPPEFSKAAKEAFDEQILQYKSTLEAQAWIEADYAETINKHDVTQAAKNLHSRKSRDWIRDILTLISGALIGSFFQGLANELLKPNLEPIPIIVYVAMGFIGMLLLVFVYRR